MAWAREDGGGTRRPPSEQGGVAFVRGRGDAGRDRGPGTGRGGAARSGIQGWDAPATDGAGTDCSGADAHTMFLGRTMPEESRRGHRVQRSVGGSAGVLSSRSPADETRFICLNADLRKARHLFLLKHSRQEVWPARATLPAGHDLRCLPQAPGLLTAATSASLTCGVCEAIRVSCTDSEELSRSFVFPTGTPCREGSGLRPRRSSPAVARSFGFASG